MAVWTWLIILLAIHIATNRAAVRAVSMQTLNRQRANIVLSTLFSDDVVLKPTQVARQERIFERDGALRWKGADVLGHAYIGVELRELLSVATRTSSTGAIRSPTVDLEVLAELFAAEQYLLWYDVDRRSVLIALKDTITNVGQLKAWAHALLVARELARSDLIRQDVATTVDTLRGTLRVVSEHIDNYVARLVEAGWDVETAALETRSGSRIVLQLE